MAVLPVGALDALGAAPFVAPTARPSAAAPGFGQLLTEGVRSVGALQQQASSASGLLATGQLTDVHEFTTAATKASLGISLTAALRNRAVEAYQEIMRMQL